MSESPKDLLAIPEDQIVKELAIPADTIAKFDAVMLDGDYSLLSKEERSLFIRMQCKRAGLAPDLNPIMFINANGKMVPYMKKGAAEQLRAMHGLNAEVTEKWSESGFVHVSVRVSDRDGRFEDDIGSCGAGQSDAYKKAITQAKRRATLGYCGMGALDPKDDFDDSNGNGPTRIQPPPVDPGARYTPPPQLASPTQPSVPRAELPDPTTGGATPPVAVPVARPAVARPKKG